MVSTLRRLTVLSLFAILLAAPGASASRALQNNNPCDGETVPKTGQCKQWCKDHPHKDFCEPLWEDLCPNKPGKDFCQPWLKTHCDGETNKPECQKYCLKGGNNKVCKPFFDEFCPNHKNKDQCKNWKPSKPADDCIHNGGERFFTSSKDAASGPSQVTLTQTFNSFQDSSLPPGQVATKNLPDLLSALGLDLTKKQIKEAKKQLDPNNTGSFSLFQFLMWWARYIVCTAFSG